MKLHISLVWLFIGYGVGSGFDLSACECPLSALSKEECGKYEIIFKGKILSVETCKDKFGLAIFEVQELYKGNAEQKFKVLFDCEGDCAYNFKVGEEWVIYSNYKQINTAMMDWCSRSRRFFIQEKEDYYTATYGNDYADEVTFLQTNLGLHRLIQKKNTADTGRNLIPNVNQSIIIVLISLGAILLFYFLFNRFFK